MSDLRAKAPTQRTEIRRSPTLANYDRSTLHEIIDAAYLCHVAFHDEAGVHCIPTACWREAEHLYIHGSNGSRLLKLLQEGSQACVTITHLDGLVLARAAFNHSMNYRSAMIYGSFERVSDEAHRRQSLDKLMDKIMPGRRHQARPGNDKEFAATTLMRIALTEAVCKTRSGGVSDDEEDLGLSVWAGVVPFVQQAMRPITDANCTTKLPQNISEWYAEHTHRILGESAQ